MRIVVRSEDARQARLAQAALSKAGIAAMAMPGPYRPAPDGEDITIVADASERIVSAARASIAPPMAVLKGLLHDAPPEAGLNEGADTVSSIALDAAPSLLAAQIEAALRLAVIEEEHARRTATAGALAIAPPKSPGPRPLRALYIGAPSAFYLELERVLGARDGSVAAAFSSFTGFDHLHDDVFDAVILNGVEEPQKALAHCAALRSNTSLMHLPTMLLTALGDDASAATAIQRGACTVAAAGEPFAPSLGWLFEAIRGERRRRGAEHGLRALRDVMGEPRTGLFRLAAFDAHLTRLASDHQASGRPLSLVAVRVAPAFGASAPADDVWRRGFSELASLAVRLLREVDSGAAFGPDVIVLALPCSDLAAARASAERIASVAECTAFAAGDDSAGPLVFERNAVELQPGEGGAGLLARALRQFETASASMA
ncbi:MAG: hypothetical protein ABL883_09095 [Terricaulis sp.]